MILTGHACWDCHIIAERHDGLSMVDHSYSTHGFAILYQYVCVHSGHQKQTQDGIQPLQLRVLHFLFSPSQLMGSQDCRSLEVMRCTSQKQILPRGGGKKRHSLHHIMFSHHPTGTRDPNGTPPLGHGPPFRVPWRRPLLSLLAPAPWRKMEIAGNQTWLAGKLAI